MGDFPQISTPKIRLWKHFSGLPLFLQEKAIRACKIISIIQIFPALLHSFLRYNAAS